MTKDLEQLFEGLLVVPIYSFVHCPFKSLMTNLANLTNVFEPLLSKEECDFQRKNVTVWISMAHAKNIRESTI
jgi:hypothetical protein